MGSYRRLVAEGGAHSHGNRAKGRPGGLGGRDEHLAPCAHLVRSRRARLARPAADVDVGPSRVRVRVRVRVLPPRVPLYPVAATTKVATAVAATDVATAAAARTAARTAATACIGITITAAAAASVAAAAPTAAAASAAAAAVTAAAPPSLPLLIAPKE